MPDRNGKIFYTSITSLSHISKVGEDVSEGTPLANIVHPYDGEIMENLYAPVESKVFFVHTDPLTYANTAVFKLV